MKRAPGSRPRRADAERSIALIIDAAIECLGRRPDASMSEIAATAGVARVTLYAHFPSREVLLDAAIDHVVARVMATLDTSRIDEGPVPEVIARMIHVAWPALDSIWGLHLAAGPRNPTWMREHGGDFLGRVDRLVTRGRADGSVRSDLPREWLVAAFFSLVHAAGQEVRDGRLDPAVAAAVLEATVIGFLAVPGQPVRLTQAG